MGGEKGEKSSLSKKTQYLSCLRMPSLDWNNVFKNLSFLSGNRQPTEMGQRDRGESEIEVKVTALWQVEIFFVQLCQVFGKMNNWVLYFRSMPSVLRKFALWFSHWEGTVRFISHTTTAHHKKFKQFLAKIINGNLVRLVRVISF